MRALLNRNSLSQGYLQEVMDYNPVSGIMTWKVNMSPCARVGDEVGCVDKTGYIRTKLNGYMYSVHRLVWLFVTGSWPENQIDHINGIRDANWWGNLRDVTNGQNKMNSKVGRNNSMGLKGVAKSRDRFKSSITHDGAKYSLGTYTTPEEAHNAYCNKADELFGQFANHGSQL